MVRITQTKGRRPLVVVLVLLLSAVSLLAVPPSSSAAEDGDGVGSAGGQTATASSSVTVVVHGGNKPIDELADRLYEYWRTQPGGARLLIYQPASGDLVRTRSGGGSGHTVLLFD